MPSWEEVSAPLRSFSVISSPFTTATGAWEKSGDATGTFNVMNAAGCSPFVSAVPVGGCLSLAAKAGQERISKGTTANRQPLSARRVEACCTHQVDRL